MSHGRRRRRQQQRPAWLPIAGGLAAVAVLVAVAYTVFGGAASNVKTVDPGAGGGAVTVAALSPDASACLNQIRAAERLVDAVQPVAESWKSYTDARTRAAIGQISEQERDSTYAEALDKGRSSIEAARAAETDYTSLSGACGQVDAVDDYPREQEAAARSCLSRAEVATAEAQAAQAVLADFAGHLNRVERLEGGRLSQQRYESLWDEAYRNAPAVLDRFLGRPVDQYRSGEQVNQPSKERLKTAPECRLLAQA